ncbi:hypothetical protein BKA70DRAFT_1247450 [Coprinopsis sp. MPI-PUGE-AT-0042]|nr:hypothetical protein BKA70DRAFT_1247450 [Coprinopsis sp. MPI-PUGE-AT-0042]
MFAVAARPVQSAIFRRSLASTVLLTRQWANETVNELRKEAKSRGLSSKGTKSLLIQRLEQFEAERSMTVAPTPSRQASTAAAAAAERPAPTPPSAEATGFMNIQLPSAAYPEPEQEAQVPYVPFHLGTREDATSQVETPGFVPKVLVVAGATTHPGGGPALASEQATDPTPFIAEEPSQSASAEETGSTNGGLFFDVAQDLGLLKFVPKDGPARTPFWKLFG